MQVLRGIPQASTQATVLTIGNFDGVHLGHQALLRQLRAKAAELGLPAAVMTFEPHPREFFAPDSAPARLSRLRTKLELLAEHGVDRCYVVRFDAALAQLTAQDFIARILVQGLAVRHLIIGDDFCFGRGREGNFIRLQQAGAQFGFDVAAMHTVSLRSERVSSSAVRDALLAGHIEHASDLLGRPYEIEGRVLHGDKIGRQLGFPTANIQLKQPRLPLDGVFAVTVSGAGLADWPGAASAGMRPTFDSGPVARLEVFLLDYAGDLYGQTLTVRFLHRLRGQEKYESMAALQAAIARDVTNVAQFFAPR